MVNELPEGAIWSVGGVGDFQMIRELMEISYRSRYRLVLRVLRQRLKSIGIEISPYYWIQEGLNDDALEKFDGSLQGYSFEFFGPQEMKIMGAIPGREQHPENKLISLLDEGKKCFGVKYQGQIAAFNWFDLEESNCRLHRFPLEDSEVYLFDMYTMKTVRGRGIAPSLRYETYKVLRKMGRSKFYSISDCFNIPSIRFKEKSHARFLELRLHIRLFKHDWNWKIKDFAGTSTQVSTGQNSN